MPRRVPVERWTSGQQHADNDWLAEESPLEVLIEFSFKGQRRTEPWGITLRTPGHDGELALGLLCAEGRITSLADVASVESLPDERVLVSLHPHVDVDAIRARTATAACGFCGSTHLPPIEVLADSGFRTAYEVLTALPAVLEAMQGDYRETGAAHAAALFTYSGQILAIREDVGRHNAVDKLIGWAMREGRLPLHQAGLLLSGRAGYELVQKAARAGVPLVAAIGAPTSLSVDVARAANISLVGFLRAGRANAYTGSWRLHGSSL